MPKIFLTGSGITRGYVTGSGYLNNPPRTILRELDNCSATYPTIPRMNRKENTGITPINAFDDAKAVKFGNKLTDTFTIEQFEKYSQAVNSRLWETSSSDVLIKKEFDPKGDLEISKGAVVLGGIGDVDGRWIKTRNKVGNPTLNFTLIQGPYGNTGALSRFKLNLGEGKDSDVFKIQGSVDGTSWSDIELKNSHLGTTNNLFINEETNTFLVTSLSSLKEKNFGVGATSTEKQFKPVLNVKLDPSDFSNSGFNEPIYIRFIQPSISDTNTSVWAIGNIDIVSRDEQVVYPHLGTQDKASIHYLNKSLATPNFTGNNLISSGSSVAGITDNKQSIDRGVIKPFNEETVIENNNTSFYSRGTSESLIPGFSRPLSSKTIINYQMKPSNSDILGTGLVRTGTNAAVGLSNDDGQILLSYWNFNLQKWEEIGQPLRDNRGNHGSKQAAHAHLYDNITGSCAGFGPGLDSIVEGGVGEFILKSPKAFEYANLPISSFGFPNAAKYHAQSGQHIKASKLGITKPFLLEKLSLDFDIKFTVPGTRTSAPGGSAADADAYTTTAIDTKPGGAEYEIRRLKIITPTFFLLRQTTKKNEASVNAYTTQTPGTLGFPGAINEPIPKTVKLTPGSNVETKVYDSREMITYGQYSLFVTASTDSGGTPDRLVDSKITMNDILDSGLVKDGFAVRTIADAESDNSFTIKDTLKFPSRVAARHSDVLSVVVHNNEPASTSGKTLILLENANESRAKSLDGASRTIVNGVTNTNIKSPVEKLIVSASNTVKAVNVNEKLVFDSPYLIFPEDNIIFGWQYPMPRDLRYPLGTPGPAPNSIKVQSCNLKMFGSLVKNGKEFHEGLNQNLTSNAIHEVIGNEPVIDQWQIATHGEMTGSISDQFMFAAQSAPAGTEDFVTGYVIGSIISPPPDENTTNSTQLLWNVGKNPVRRVNSRFNSTFSVNNVSILGDSSVNPLLFISNFDAVTGPKSPANGFIQQIQAFTNLADLKRVYSDSTILNGSDTTSPYGSYGSSQNYTYMSGVTPAQIIKLGGSPKYYYSTKHYGHFSDLVRQGLDSKSKRVIQRGSRVVVSPAVRVNFVEDDYDEVNLNFRKFSLIKPSDVDGTAYESFQSSNISLFATSSLPFFDNNTPTNRTYSISAVEVI